MTLSPFSIMLASCAISVGLTVLCVVLARLTAFFFDRPSDNGLRYEWQMNRKVRRQ